MPKPYLLSQRSLQDAPIFRLLLKVAVKGTHQCDFFNFWGGFGLPTNRNETIVQTATCARLTQVCEESPSAPTTYDQLPTTFYRSRQSATHDTAHSPLPTTYASLLLESGHMATCARRRCPRDESRTAASGTSSTINTSLYLVVPVTMYTIIHCVNLPG